MIMGAYGNVKCENCCDSYYELDNHDCEISKIVEHKDQVISKLITELNDCSFMLWQILQYSPNAHIDTKKIQDAFKKRKRSIDPLIAKYGKDQ